MAEYGKVIKGLKQHRDGRLYSCDNCPYVNNTDCQLKLYSDALELLKAQEQELNRLKHHIDCDAAEKIPSGCVGYGRGLNDDEPCETCKVCEKYNGHEEWRDNT